MASNLKVLITARSGVGKSTIIHELSDRGCTVYDTDEMPEISRLEVKATEEPTKWPLGYVDWDYYGWNWQGPELDKLLNTSNGAIIGAIMSNQQNFYHLFDITIVLTCTSETLRKRLLHRTDYTYGNNIENIERSVMRHAIKQAVLTTQASFAVDNERPPVVVANDIIRIMNDY